MNTSTHGPALLSLKHSLARFLDPGPKCSTATLSLHLQSTTLNFIPSVLLYPTPHIHPVTRHPSPYILPTHSFHVRLRQQPPIMGRKINDDAQEFLQPVGSRASDTNDLTVEELKAKLRKEREEKEDLMRRLKEFEIAKSKPKPKFKRRIEHAEEGAEDVGMKAKKKKDDAVVAKETTRKWKSAVEDVGVEVAFEKAAKQARKERPSNSKEATSNGKATESAEPDKSNETWDWTAFNPPANSPVTKTHSPLTDRTPAITTTAATATAPSKPNHPTSFSSIPVPAADTTTHDLATINTAFRFALSWLCPYGPDPHLAAVLQIIREDALHDKVVRDVLVAVLRQSARSVQWEAWRGFVRAGRRVVKMQEMVDRVEGEGRKEGGQGNPIVCD